MNKIKKLSRPKINAKQKEKKMQWCVHIHAKNRYFKKRNESIRKQNISPATVQLDDDMPSNYPFEILKIFDINFNFKPKNVFCLGMPEKTVIKDLFSITD